MRVETWNITGSSFHFGRHGLGQEESGHHLPSDSLFAALVSRQSALGGAPGVETWMQYFVETPPAFVLSSAYPRVGDLRLFPRPLRTLPAEKTKADLDTKDLKRVRFVSEGVLLQLLNGSSLEAFYSRQHTLQDGAVLYLPAEQSQLPKAIRINGHSIWTKERRPRVTLGRARVNSALYFTGRTAFAPDCGLWFMVRWLEKKDDLVNRLKDALMELGDAGLGGERSSGFGQAKFTPGAPVELPDPGGLPWVTLSRYLPAGQDLPALLYPHAAYSIETVGGWVESPGNPAERRRSVRMLTEGSVFGPLARIVPGQIADVQPDYDGKQPLGHPVWRSGLALAVGFPALAGK